MTHHLTHTLSPPEFTTRTLCGCAQASFSYLLATLYITSPNQDYFEVCQDCLEHPAMALYTLDLMDL